LSLYSARFLKLFMGSRSFGVKFFGSLRWKIVSSANRDTLSISLPICIPVTSFSYISALVRNSGTMLDRSGMNEHHCLIPDFRGNDFSFSSLTMMLVIGLSHIAFIMLRYITSIPSFLRAFIMKFC
jgi:hypothetical protein